MAKQTVKQRRKEIRRRARRDPGIRLLDEIGRYIKANGGSAVIAGPIRLVEWPEDADRNAASPEYLRFFAVDVKVMGRKPVDKKLEQDGLTKWPLRKSFGEEESAKKGDAQKSTIRNRPATPSSDTNT